MDLSYRLYSLVGNCANDGFKLYGLYLMGSGEVGKGVFAICTSLAMDVVMASGMPERHERNLYDRVKYAVFDLDKTSSVSHSGQWIYR